MVHHNSVFFHSCLIYLTEAKLPHRSDHTQDEDMGLQKLQMYHLTVSTKDRHQSPLPRSVVETGNAAGGDPGHSARMQKSEHWVPL